MASSPCKPSATRCARRSRRFTAAKLSFGHGSANAYDEAAYLVLHTLNLPLDTLDPFLDARLLPEEVQAVLDVIERRVTERVPAAYITHEAFMHGLGASMWTPRVIVPRSFIGELLQEGLEPRLGETHGITTALELCTGSGCLPIIAAHVWPNARIDAVDSPPTPWPWRAAMWPTTRWASASPCMKGI